LGKVNVSKVILLDPLVNEGVHLGLSNVQQCHGTFVKHDKKENKKQFKTLNAHISM
jgi:hypothetical protein